MELFIDILRVVAIVLVVIVAGIAVTFHQIAIRDQNEPKDGDSE